jgi:hypothetical protein
MAVVQPRTERQQQGDEFQLVDGGQRLVYRSAAPNLPRKIISFVGSGGGISAGVPAFISSLIAFAVGASTIGFWLLVFAGVAFSFAYGMFRWGKRGAVRTVEFDKSAITVDGKSYLLEHVSEIGFGGLRRLSSNPNVHGLAALASKGLESASAIPRLRGVAAIASHGLNSSIYIRYGVDEIVIIRDLPPEQVDMAHRIVTEFLAQFGHQFQA